MLLFSPGSYLGKHRKLMPTASERVIWGFGDGSTLPVFDTSVGRVGAVICWESYMPMLRVAMYSKGIQSTAPLLQMTATHGCRRCGTSHSKGDVLYSPAVSSPGAVTTPQTMRQTSAMIPMWS